MDVEQTELFGDSRGNMARARFFFRSSFQTGGNAAVLEMIVQMQSLDCSMVFNSVPVADLQALNPLRDVLLRCMVALEGPEKPRSACSTSLHANMRSCWRRRDGMRDC